MRCTSLAPAARILTIYEGTSQIQKLIISRDMIENALRTRMA